VRFESYISEEGILEELGRRLVAARLRQNLTQAEVAGKTGVSLRTLQRLESGYGGTHLDAFVKVCHLLGLSKRFEIIFPENEVSPVELLKRQGKIRKRASKKKSVPAKKWKWGDE